MPKICFKSRFPISRGHESLQRLQQAEDGGFLSFSSHRKRSDASTNTIHADLGRPRIEMVGIVGIKYEQKRGVASGDSIYKLVPTRLNSQRTESQSVGVYPVLR